VTWTEATHALATYDGRETAPEAARPEQFLRGLRPMPFPEAASSGLSIGVPGLARLLELAHRREGRLSWSQLFEPAIKLATEGVIVSPRLASQLKSLGASAFTPAARAYFFDATGEPRAAGARLANPDYAATLRSIAQGGADAFYSGPIAQAI